MDWNCWWHDQPDEVYWMETTDRPDIDANPNAPQRDENDQEMWSYTLVGEVRETDVVVHYPTRPQRRLLDGRA
jgi:hypothetical protein